MNIILYKGQSKYDVLRFFIDEMASAFIKLGHKTTIIDLLAKDWPSKLHKTLVQYQVCDFVFSFNAMGGVITANDQTPLYDYLNIPFVTALVDHPCHHAERLDTIKINHLLVNCIDKTHWDFLASYFPPDYIKFKGVLQQAGTSVATVGKESLDEYIKKRTIPFLFAGSILPPVKGWHEMPLNKSFIRLGDDIADYILAHDCITLEAAYTHVMAERALQLSADLQKKLYLNLFRSVYRYIWAYCRQQVLETLAKAQVPLAVCNDGSGGYLEKYKSVTFIGKRPYTQLLFDLQKTVFSLNTTTMLWSGASERVFDSMVNGAVSVSQVNHNPDLIDGENCVLYQWRKLDELPGKILRLLENPETTWQMAQNATRQAEAKHLWLHRARQIVEMVSIYQDLSKSNKNTGGTNNG